MNVTLLHNPRCSKSRATLALLQERGIEPTVREYLQQPLSSTELRELVSMLGIQTRELLRKGEAEYAERSLGSEERSEDELLDAMASAPILMQRPVVVCGERAAIGRPPHAVLDILPDSVE